MVESAATSNGYATLTPDEVHHKMCKKIAQLTKVIFHLNSKNEENERLVQAHTKAYQRDIDTLTVEYNQRVAALSDIVKQSKAHEETLLGEVNSTKAIASREKDRAAERLLSLEGEYSKALKGQEDAFENELVNVLERVRAMKSEHEKESKALTNSIDELKRRHEAGAEALRQSHEKQLSRLKSQSDSAAEEFEKQLLLEREAHAESLRRLEEEHGVALARAERISEEKASEAEKRFQSELLRAEERVEVLRGELAHREDALASLRSEREESLKQLSELQSQLSQKEARVGEHERELVTLQKIIGQKAASVREKEEKVRHIEEEMSRQESSNPLRLELEERDEELARKVSEVEALTKALRDAQTTIKGKENALAEASAENARLKGDLCRSKGRLRSLETEMGGENQSLRSALDLARAEARRVDAEWQERAKDAAANSKAEMGELKRGHGRELEDTARRFEDEITALRKAKQESEMRLEELQRTELDTKAEDHEQEKRTMKRFVPSLSLGAALVLVHIFGRSVHDTRMESLDGFREFEVKLEDAMRGLREEIDKRRALTEEWEAERQRLEKTNATAERSKQSLESRVMDLEERLLGKDADLERQAAANMMALDELRGRLEAELQRRLKEAEESLLRTEEVRRSEMLQEKEKRMEGLNSEILLLREELRSIQDELARERRRGEEVVEATRMGAKDRAELLERQMAERLSLMESEAKSAREKWTQERQQLMEEHKAKAERAEAIHRQVGEVESAREEEMKKWEEILEAERARCTRELEQKQARHEVNLRRLKEEHEAGTKALREKIEEVRRTLESRVEEMQESKKRREEELQLNLDEAKRALLELNRKVDAQSREITDKDTQLGHLSSRLAEETTALRQRLQREVEEHRHEMRAASEARKEEVDDLINEHRRVMEARDEVARQTEEEHNNRVLQLNSRVEELIRMYDNRPSREEDVVRIDHLTGELKRLNHSYEELAERMKVYKLELINREQNYNKVFGANPTIGVYNPLKEPLATPLGGRAAEKQQQQNRKPSGAGPTRKTLGKKSVTMDV
ncbi:hypothetical protein FOZ61_000664 [Perkinsus olseni]|uniref:Protein FAM184A/B N-terminal domain-containing protein n=1 Tax=Perkinsus olseni TaxID=32597 RepID=A0A7J6KSN4_PEROL|nr:hypothetical protein FOZ61_000664 [Perkinsus olseni]KAF4650960.1 hypothetical protein FOL46_000625 [Perkinsus olseni]